MFEHVEDLARTNLFYGISPDEIKSLLGCLNARKVEYSKGEFIVEEGSNIYDFGIVLSGHARSVIWDSADRMIIITLLEKGSEIGVMLAASPEHKAPVSVQAQDDASILLISYDRVLAGCEKGCPKHEQLLRNFIQIVAEKGLVLHERIDCLLKPSVRDKISAYLTRVTREQHSQTIIIPMNRNAMAEYLNIERSALSRELSCMKREGLIDYHMNSFRIFDFQR